MCKECKDHGKGIYSVTGSKRKRVAVSEPRLAHCHKPEKQSLTARQRPQEGLTYVAGYTAEGTAADRHFISEAAVPAGRHLEILPLAALKPV